jgi:hypothetical protein
VNAKRLLLLALLLAVAFATPKPARALDLPEIITSENSLITKIQEGVEYFFAFGTENKIQVLEKHAEKRLAAAQNQVEAGNSERVQNLVQSYLQVKEKQNSLLEKTGGETVLGTVQERTVEQQKTMEEIKTRIDEGTKQEVIQVQERVVNQVAKRVVEVNGPEGATEFLNEAAHVWAPGTGPGGEARVVYEGGGKLIYAPGTGPGGPGGVVIEGGELRFAPGTEPGSGPGGEAKTDIQNVVVESDSGGGEGNNQVKTEIEGNN